MIVRVHSFDWKIYSERIMPAFHVWLVNANEQAIAELYRNTKRAKAEEQRVTPLHQHNSWQQAQAFVKRLPRGPHAIDEYHILCTPERFTPLSDRFMYRYSPQLYRNSEALRVIWSTLIEEYCLPWFQVSGESEKFLSPSPQVQAEQKARSRAATTDKHVASTVKEREHEEGMLQAKDDVFRSELVSLLQSAGLTELAQAITIYAVEEEELYHEMVEKEEEGDEEEEEREAGVLIGQQPAPIRLRGWLAAFSLRAMALFELLACGRRCMPFGYEASDLATGYIGYLTPEEVWQLALCLRKMQSPSPEQVTTDFQQFQKQLREKGPTLRMLDEVLPEYSDEFMNLVRIAALQGWGLICSVG